MAMEHAQRCLYCDHAHCAKGCPLHNDIPAALFLLGQEDFIGAALKTAASAAATHHPIPVVC